MSLSDYKLARPETAGLKSEPLHALVKWLDGFDEANIHGIVVVRHGMLLFEHYRLATTSVGESRLEKWRTGPRASMIFDQ